MGNDKSRPDAPGNTCTSIPIHEGGFFDVESLPAGRYLFIYRKDKNAVINLAAVRAFQSPNLLEYGAKIIHDYTPTLGYEAKNLITHLDVRSSRWNKKPVIDAYGTTTTAFNSCFRVATNQISTGDPFVTTIDHSVEVFVNAVLLVLDVRAGKLGSRPLTTLDKYYASQWDIYVGNSPVWSENTKCNETPFLEANYQDRYSTWTTPNKDVPDYGFEAWCNLPG